MKNLLEQFLDELEVPYTRRFADGLYNEHPHRYNMFGLKNMLEVYGLNTRGVWIKDKDLSSLTFPCILHTHDDFVIASDYKDGKLTYLHNGTQTTSGQTEFSRIWTGNALVAEESPAAGEPDYRLHRRNDTAECLKRYSLPVMMAAAAAVGIISNHSAIGLYGGLNLMLCAIGLVICAFLMQKQILGKSRYGDRVCSLFGHSDCNDVLDGNASKIMGISWSEVGFGYFTANLLILSLFPEAFGTVAVINWLAMPYGIWSVLYQWKVAHAWCVLCISVQGVVWITGVTDAVYVTETSLAVNAVDSILSCMVFVACILLTHISAALYAAEDERIRILQRYRSLKANGKVATALITDGEHHEVTLDDSSIVFGPADASIRITILSNPHCNPCARLHTQVESLLSLNKGHICIQYIFSSFSRELDDSSRYLINCYQENDQHEARHLFDIWYAGDGVERKRMVESNADRIHSNEVEAEMERHGLWRDRERFYSTPTVLVNGHILPKEYELMDLAVVANI